MEDKIAEMVYNRLLGHNLMETEVYQVENLFEEGSRCDELYQEIYEANLRLCQRLGVEEDRDIQTIIDAFWEINRLVGEKMYRHGQLNGK